MVEKRRRQSPWLRVSRDHWFWISSIWIMLYLCSSIPQVSGIGCFVCTSVNGTEPDCEDTFNNTGRFYQQECFAGRKGRSGLFPGTECIKLKAQHGLGYEILVRTCVVDNGDINSQTEIGRIDHCGFVNWITYNDEDMKGCILNCDTDGCNSASIFTWSPLIILLTSVCMSVTM